MKFPPRWSALQGLGTNKAVNSSLIWLILIPFLTRGIDALDAQYQLNLSLPFNALMLYCAALVFTIASVVFQIWCPTLVKAAPRYGLFIAGSYSQLELKNWFRDIAGSSKSKGEADGRLIYEFLTHARGAHNADVLSYISLLGGTAKPDLMAQ